MPAPAWVSARAYRRISVPPAATRVSIPALSDVLPDQGSHVSVAAIRFTFTVRRTIPAPARSRTRCHERPARQGPAGAPAHLSSSPLAVGTRRDATSLPHGPGPLPPDA